MDDQTVRDRTVIDLRTSRPVERRILELAGPGSDPGWIAGLLNRVADRGPHVVVGGHMRAPIRIPAL